MDKLYTALENLENGSLEPRIATAMASVSAAILRAYESAELEDRLEALESVLEPERRRMLTRRSR
jgi:hypothetical protein